MGAFIGLYVAQIVLALIILAAVPKREDLPAKINNGRDNAIKLGFVPCVGIMLFYQLVFLGLYFAAKGREDSKRTQLAGRLTATSFDSPSVGSSSPAGPGANPFADPATGSGGAGSAASDNPFL